jgi:hypothetical protein
MCTYFKLEARNQEFRQGVRRESYGVYPLPLTPYPLRIRVSIFEFRIFILKILYICLVVKKILGEL